MPLVYSVVICAVIKLSFMMAILLIFFQTRPFNALLIKQMSPFVMEGASGLVYDYDISLVLKIPIHFSYARSVETLQSNGKKQQMSPSSYSENLIIEALFFKIMNYPPLN